MRRKKQSGSPLRLGFVPLADCAPIAMARELGLFAKYGIEVELKREVGWATIRDKIIYGELEAAHAPAGMVVAATLGLGSIQTECLTGLVINLHGNAITLSQKLWSAGVHDGKSLREEIELQRGKKRFVFGAAFTSSSHNFLLRLWLRAHGILADRDVQIVVVPPPQMCANLKGGHLDGYCVGEPWNSLAVMSKIGWVAATSAELSPSHVEKILMVRRTFAEEREIEHLALIAALVEACRFCDQPQNRDRIIETLAQPEYVGAPVQALRMSMKGTFDFGNGRNEKCADFHVFSRYGANEPTAEKASWVVQSLRDSGVLLDPTAIAPGGLPQMFRTDIFHKATQLIQP